MFLQSILTWLLVQCAAWRLEVARLLPRKIEHSRPSLLLSWKRSQPCRVFKHVSHTFVFLSNLFGHFSGAGVFEAVRAFVCSRYLLIDTWSMDSMQKDFVLRVSNSFYKGIPMTTWRFFSKKYLRKDLIEKILGDTQKKAHFPHCCPSLKSSVGETLKTAPFARQHLSRFQ